MSETSAKERAHREELFTQLRNEAAFARQRLRNAVEHACPGPHIVTQHRDRKPPWCRVCGYSSDGVMCR